MIPQRSPIEIGILAGLALSLLGALLPFLLPRIGVSIAPEWLAFWLSLLIFCLLSALWIVLHRETSRLFPLLDNLAAALPKDARHDWAGTLADVLNKAGHAVAARLAALEKEAEKQVIWGRLQGYKRERIESVLEAHPDAVVFLDEEGQAVACNGKIGLLAGVGPAEIIGRGVPEWPVMESVRHAVSELLSTMQESSGGHVHIFMDEAHERRISIFARTVFALRSANRRSGFLLLIRETTDEWLAHKGRDEFIAHVAHELKTPLGNVMLYGEQLRDMVDPADALAVESANTVCDEADRMTRLINNLLDISRIEAGTLSLDLQRVRLHDLLEDCMETVDYAARAKGISTRLQVPSDMAPVRLDKSLIRVALSNLLSNAVKYNRPDGDVVLAAEESPDEVILSVQDTGIGIPDEDVPHLFDKYYRSSDAEAASRGGHGLGLYLAKRIAELHSGRIEASSCLGAGSRFQMVIPASRMLL